MFFGDTFFWDHPRVGGEKLTTFDAGKLIPGSPPRGRGKAVRTGIRFLCFRITPAWAGKSRPFGDIYDFVRDHPRVGGEKVQILLYEDIQKGSPPRGRGKVNRSESKSQWYRITPAWAGKSPHRLCHPVGVLDHPRVGGEKPAVAAHVRAQLGSPPRGRGKD